MPGGFQSFADAKCLTVSSVRFGVIEPRECRGAALEITESRKTSEVKIRHLSLTQPVPNRRSSAAWLLGLREGGGGGGALEELHAAYDGLTDEEIAAMRSAEVCCYLFSMSDTFSVLFLSFSLSFSLPVLKCCSFHSSRSLALFLSLSPSLTHTLPLSVVSDNVQYLHALSLPVLKYCSSHPSLLSPPPQRFPPSLSLHL